MRLIKLMPGLVFCGIATISAGAFAADTAVPQEPNPSISTLLNKANVINYEEIQMAKVARDKAGDNQPLLTFADTLQADHKANEDAVSALARQTSVKIEGTPSSVDQKEKQMEALKGGQFDQAFLRDEVADHTKALQFFEAEKAKFRGDPDVNLYVQETIPVIRAHLEMARSLEQEIGNNSKQNPENNKNISSSR